MAPVSLGTETDGSILMPSDRSSLYSVKITPGSVSTRGILPYIALGDSPGPMTTSPEDAALVLSVLLNRPDLPQNLTKSFAGLKIGFLDPVVWESNPNTVRPNQDYTEQYVRTCVWVVTWMTYCSPSSLAIRIPSRYEQNRIGRSYCQEKYYPSPIQLRRQQHD